MAKSKVLCAHCDAKINKADAFCPNCKHPTLFATVEQRTAWELEQWTSKRASSRKKVVAHSAGPVAKPKRASAMIEQPAQTTKFVAAARIEPIRRQSTPRTIHPAVAARAARVAAAAAEPMSSASHSSSPVNPIEKDRVIVLPDAPATSRPGAATMRKAVVAAKKEAAPKKKAVAKEAAPKKDAAAAATTRPKASRKAPKMGPMQIEGPAAKTNGHAPNGNGTDGQGTSEQTEILRELLRRVTAIEEKMTPAPRARGFRLRKR
ncbi:MAG TPA: hypothetical protein VKV69_05820 [Actinomycetota bacterium]|nr:hypothetical protein [Actinomycetota bacterium]